MEARTAGDGVILPRRIALYGAITLLLVGAVLAPALLHVAYLRVLNTLILFGLVGLIGRTVCSAAVSFARPSVPELTVADGDLPAVSIVVPAYNEEPVLPATIDACRAVDYPDEKLEIVLCYEAASTDRTAAICEEAAAEDPRIRAVERDEPGGGKAKATNYALRYASGELIASIDADHRFEPGAIRRAVAWFVDDPDVWCVKGRCYGDNPDDSLIALHATVERHIAEKADLFGREVMGGFTIFGGGQAFFRSELFDELGKFDEEVLVEDVDMSARIHGAGKRIRVDPGVITYEENPATLADWWNQRKRWSRGWMQVAARYIARLPGDAPVPLRVRADAIYTFTYAVVPVFLVLAIPLGILTALPGVTTTTYLSNDIWLWAALGVAPTVTAYTIFLQDRRDGHRHHPREYLAAFTLWLYLGLQTVVFITAFIEEFVLGKRAVYVTTSRAAMGTDPADD